MSSKAYDFQRREVQTWPVPFIGIHIAFMHLFNLEIDIDL